MYDTLLLLLKKKRHLGILYDKNNLCYDDTMKKDIELDNLLEEYQNLMNPKEDGFRTIKEDSMFLAMSDKYGRKPHDRDAVIKSLKEDIERKRFKKQLYHALDELELIKSGKKKVHKIETLWDEL